MKRARRLVLLVLAVILLTSTVAAASKPASVMLDAPLINQNPELNNGCEITSLTMLLQYAKLKVNKMQLAAVIPKDPTPIRFNSKGEVIYWGDPNVGFVGDVTGKRRGYAIYHKPLHQLLKKYIPSAVDLTGKYLPTLEKKLAEKKPVVVWTSNHFGKPLRWVSWKSPTGTIRATYEEHAVLLVGYDAKYLYVNDPLSVRKQYRIEKKRFISGWEAFGRQAISY